MTSMTIAIFVGHFYGRNPDRGFLEWLVVLFIVVPLMTIILLTPLYNPMILTDRPDTSQLQVPAVATMLIWFATVIGGFLGQKSGNLWIEGESSCIYCLLTVTSLLAVGSLAVVLFL
jgi:hypothetical protein